MKKILILFIFVLSLAMMTGCVMTKEQSYFQNMDSVSLAGVKMRPEIHIKPNDELTITVTSTNPEAAEPFNMTLRSGNYGSSYTNQEVSKQLYNYVVDQDGYINFPVIGKVHVEGLTRPQCEDFLLEQVKPYFSAEERPVVKVRFSSFTVTVIGEVGSSRTLNVSNERLSIIEALAQAGNLSVYGKRPNVLLIRELPNGEKVTARYNLNDANMLNSEFYYLQQNDVVYVEPHKSKARSADVSSYTFWTPISSVLLSIATLIVSITR